MTATTEQRPQSAQPWANGFTLIELLVVVSIITMLIAMLMPALQRGRHVAKEMKCSSNLRQLASTVIDYAIDYSRYPMYGSPRNPDPPVPAPWATYFWNNHGLMWGYNPSGETRPRLIAASTVYDPSAITVCPLDQGYEPGSGLPGTFNNIPFARAYGTSYLYQSTIRNAAGTSHSFEYTSSEVLWKRGPHQINNPSSLVMAGDWTLLHPENIANGYSLKHYSYTRMHHPVRYLAATAFADGHVTTIEIGKSADHLMNAEYDLLRVDDSGAARP